MASEKILKTLFMETRTMSHYNNGTHEVRGLSRISRLVLAISDILGRKFVTALTVIAVSMAITISLLLNGYGHHFYRAQEELVSQEVPTVVTVSCSDPTDLEQRLTDERLTEFENDSRIVAAYPRIEINVTLQHEGKTITIPAEGILAEDPRLTQNRLHWRSPHHIPGKEGLVIGRRLFEKMGGLVVSGSPTPKTFTIRVARTQEGQRQEDALALPLAAITRQKNGDCVYIPIEIAERLDLFCSHKASTVLSDGTFEMKYPGAIVYVPEKEMERIPEETGNLNTQMQELGHMEYPDWKGPVWVLGSFADDVLAKATEQGDLYSHHNLPIEIGGESLIVAGLAENDPRWKECDDLRVTPEVGTLYTVSDRAANRSTVVHDGIVYQVCRSSSTHRFPVNADYICSVKTLKRMSFEPVSCPLNRPLVFVYTSSVEDAFTLQGAIHNRIQADKDGFAWSIFVDANTVSGSKKEEALRNDNANANVTVPERNFDRQSHITDTSVRDDNSNQMPDQALSAERVGLSTDKVHELIRDTKHQHSRVEIKEVLSGQAHVKNKRFRAPSYELQSTEFHATPISPV